MVFLGCRQIAGGPQSENNKTVQKESSMKKGLAAILITIALGLQTQAGLIITEVMSNSDHPGGAGNGDWFEVYNNGTSAMDLTGYSWDDDSALAGTHTFGSVSIAASGFVLVVDEKSSNIDSWKNDVWGITAQNVVALGNSTMDFSGLGSGGDSVYLYDASSNQVASVTFGDSDGGGKTFAWDASGNSLGFSADGVNGAFVAPGDGAGGAGTDIGSPGVVPEPGTVAMLGIGGLMAIAIRRLNRFNRA